MKALSEGPVKVNVVEEPLQNAVFGLLKRNGKIFYTAIIPNSRAENLMPSIEEQVEPDSIVFIDSFKAYNALDARAFHHHRSNHRKLFAAYENHINGIENS